MSRYHTTMGEAPFCNAVIAACAEAGHYVRIDVPSLRR